MTQTEFQIWLQYPKLGYKSLFFFFFIHKIAFFGCLLLLLWQLKVENRRWRCYFFLRWRCYFFLQSSSSNLFVIGNILNGDVSFFCWQWRLSSGTLDLESLRLKSHLYLEKKFQIWKRMGIEYFFYMLMVFMVLYYSIIQNFGLLIRCMGCRRGFKNIYRR